MQPPPASSNGFPRFVPGRAGWGWTFCFVFPSFPLFQLNPKKKETPLLLSVPAPPTLFLTFPSRMPGIGLGVKKGKKSKKRRRKKNLTAFPTNDIVGNGRCDLQLSFTIPGTDEDVQRRKSRPSFCKNRIGWGVNSTSFFFLLRRARFIFLFRRVRRWTEGLGMIKNPEF